MKIVGLMAARNEEWCLGLTARAALMWLDELVILDHASTDGTSKIIDEVSHETERVSRIAVRNPLWEEMKHRQMMLDIARDRKATHICYIDADEILTGDLLRTELGRINIRHMFRSIPPASILEIPWLALRGSIGQVHVSGPWADSQVASFGFEDSPKLHWSSAERGGYDFHHRAPMGKPLIPWQPLGGANPLVTQKRESGLMHLQFVSGRRLRAKQYLYQLTERLRWPDREPVRVVRERYSLAVYGQRTPSPLPPTGLGPVPSMESWWGPYQHLMKYFHPHMEPWQLAECERIRRENPGIEKDLDDFGLFSDPFHSRV